MFDSVEEKPDLLVTVCIPIYNHEHYVVETLKSIIDQDYKDIELIVINDGSTDKSHEKVMQYYDECEVRFANFKYINRNNLGLSKTLGEGLDKANGKYFIPIASDDKMLASRVSSTVNFFEQASENYAGVYGDVSLIDEQSKEVRFLKKRNELTSSFLEIYAAHIDYKNPTVFGSYKSLILGNYLPAAGQAYRTTCLRELNAFNSHYTIEDWELLLKASKKYKLAYMDACIGFYRVHDSNSVIKNTVQILYDELELLKNEKLYSKANNLMHFWLKGYVRVLLSLWITKKNGLVVKELFNCGDIRALFYLIYAYIKLLLKSLIRRLLVRV